MPSPATSGARRPRSSRSSRSNASAYRCVSAAVAFLIGAGVMALGGIAELFLGVKAEHAPLEDIAKPLTVEEAEEGGLPGDEQEESEDQRRWRERDERSRTPRYRPGPGGGERFYSPGMIGTAGATRRAHPSVRDREVEAIAAALDDGGPMRIRELQARVGGRRWGPAASTRRS